MIPLLHSSYLEEPHKQWYIQCPHVESCQQLGYDYFAPNYTYLDDVFCQRCLMHRELLHCINNNVEIHNTYFMQKYDASGRLGLSSIQKATTVLHIFANGFFANYYDEYLKIREATAIKSLKDFSTTVIYLYEAEYL